MPTLYANKLWCSDETNEVGLDDIYLVCLVGRPNPPQFFLISVGPGNYWNSMEEGDKRNRWIKLYENYSSSTLHLVAMMEKDLGKDIEGEARKKVENIIGFHYKKLQTNLGGASNLDFAKILMPVMNDAIKEYGADDDRVSTHLLELGGLGSSKWLNFTGDGGKYWVQFTIGNP
jgi:hypothetical protein